MISIDEEDFLEKNFALWKVRLRFRMAREIKMVLFPEKINGEFAVLHSIIGDDNNHVRIEFTDDLTALSERNHNTDPQKIPDENIAWHIHTGAPVLRRLKQTKVGSFSIMRMMLKNRIAISSVRCCLT